MQKKENTFREILQKAKQEGMWYEDDPDANPKDMHELRKRIRKAMSGAEEESLKGLCHFAHYPELQFTKNEIEHYKDWALKYYHRDEVDECVNAIPKKREVLLKERHQSERMKSFHRGWK